MNITKLPSGNYRIRKNVNGTMYSKTVNFKPKKWEADQIIAEMVETGETSTERLTVGLAIDKYIALKENVLSPATIMGYSRYKKKYPQSLLNKPLSSVTTEQVQLFIDSLTRDYSPKYVHNVYGLLSAVLGFYRPKFIPAVTLPKLQKKEPYIPVDDDVKRVMEAIEGTEYEIAIALAAFGLRRSEICALTMEDIKDGYIIINKTLVPDKSGKFVINRTNNKSDIRYVNIPEKLEEKIREKGYIYRKHPDSQYRFLKRTLERLGIPQFSIHKLRHYYASESHALQVPDAYILQQGGWKTDHVMKRVYRHAQKDKIDKMGAPIVEHLESFLK